MTLTLRELSALELDELGIDPPRHYLEAYRNDETTITIMVPDEDGGDILDNPRDDQSGEDAWEWIEFDNGQERDEWRLENSVCSVCTKPIEWDYDDDAWKHADGKTYRHIIKPAMAPNDFLIERYEHGLVRYAPIGEASQVDRQWDVAHGVAVIRFTKPETIGPDDNPDKLLNFARGICEEYTSWCNGDIYGMIRFELQPPAGATSTPFLSIDEFVPEWVETDSCWGFIGWENATEIAKTGDW